jgi:hypothetical protein
MGENMSQLRNKSDEQRTIQKVDTNKTLPAGYQDYCDGLYAFYGINMDKFKHDIPLAMKHFLSASEQGHVKAMCFVSLIFCQGCEGYPKDMTTAQYWKEKAMALDPMISDQILGIASGSLIWILSGINTNDVNISAIL